MVVPQTGVAALQPLSTPVPVASSSQATHTWVGAPEVSQTGDAAPQPRSVPPLVSSSQDAQKALVPLPMQ